MNNTLRNHKQRWNLADQAKIEEMAKHINNREQLEKIAKEKAPEFERTVQAVAKRIELVKGWHYRQG